MSDPVEDRLRSLHRDLSEGAAREGEPPPREEEVRTLAALLRRGASEVAIPGDLVPALRAACAQAAQEMQAPRRPTIRALLCLLWAEARFLPLPFIVLQAALLALALVANRYLTGFAGPGAPLPWPGGPAGNLVMRAILRDALGRSVDALTLAAPWLGTAVVLFAVLPARRGLWADLEALSPFSGPTRLLARTGVATFVAAAATLVVGLAHLGPAPHGGGAPAALLLVARAAPLFLAVSWALAWSLVCGAPGAAVASLALWGGLTWFGGGLGRWDLFAPPMGAAPVQALALAAALALFALVAAQAGRLEPRGRGGGL